jgi:hypothetical protein
MTSESAQEPSPEQTLSEIFEKFDEEQLEAFSAACEKRIAWSSCPVALNVLSFRALTK